MSIQDKFTDYCDNRKSCVGCPYSNHNEADLVGCALNFAYEQGKADGIEDFVNWLFNLPRPVTTFVKSSKEEIIKEFKKERENNEQ